MDPADPPGGRGRALRPTGELMTTVLVADDEPDIRELVRLNLALDGHDVLLASNGNDAIGIAIGSRPDCVVLDVMMPGKDGWQVLEELKSFSDPAIAHIPVILLTARIRDVDRIRGGIEGAIRYLTKPFSPADLRREVDAALAGEPEPQKRRTAQARALEQLARLEDGRSDVPDQPPPRPRLTRLQRSGDQSPKTPYPTAMGRMAKLSERQRDLLRTVAETTSVTEAAERLGISRSNAYASLRRIVRRLDAGTVPDLVRLVRSGNLPVDG